MKIIRVFPSKNNCMPDDDNVRFGEPGVFDEADEVHISVTFTWDIKRAEHLYNQWKYVANTKIGGVAIGTSGGQFTPGMYIKDGYVITSRGCNNKCWFCEVWKRDGKIKELEIKDGWNLLDDNILQCSENHINNVFDMLKRQKHEIRLTGGLEAKLITEGIAKKLYNIRPKYLYFAYDTPDDLKPLQEAGEILKNVGFKNHLKCYVLIGYPKDTIEKARKRMYEVIDAGFMPFAMLYRNKDGITPRGWQDFKRKWANRTITGYLIYQYKNEKHKRQSS